MFYIVLHVQLFTSTYECGPHIDYASVGGDERSSPYIIHLGKII